MRYYQGMKSKLKYALIAIGLAILVVLLSDFNARIAELNRLRREHEQVATQLAGMQGTQAALQTQIVYATSDAAVLENAYEEYRMVQPGDVLVVPLAAETATPTPIVPTASEPVTHAPWEYWFALFFEETP